MGTRRIRRKQRRGTSAKDALVLEYYQHPFSLIGEGLLRQGYNGEVPHEVRGSFWSVVPPGKYDPLAGRQIVKTYLQRVERELQAVISKQSIAYWLHLYRRTGIGVTGRNQSPATIYNVRATFEAAVQKYACPNPCNRIGVSNEIPSADIFRGLLLSGDLRNSLAAVLAFPQLVLTAFGVDEMRELYDTEKLAYEVWKCMATLRILGKGANLIVCNTGECFFDDRSEELDKLVVSYDNRSNVLNTSATGTTFRADRVAGDARGYMLTAQYNVHKVSAEVYEAWFKHFGIAGFKNPEGGAPVTNFRWAPFGLLSYYQSHLPFRKAFEKKHGIPLDWIIATIAALHLAVMHLWVKHRGRIGHYWQRAYDGPSKKDSVIESLETLFPFGFESLGLKIESSKVDLHKIFAFFALNDSRRKSIDVGLAGPFSVFLPYGEDRVFTEYAWFDRLLFNLFFGTKVDDEGDFKGEMLERMVHRDKSVLPTKPCQGNDGTSRQVDAAFELNDVLVICECKAVWRSLGYERGDPSALEFRYREVVDRALSEADEKARWLHDHPVGSNYDIRKYHSILPVGVSPFVEYFASLGRRYWITPDLPRVLTPTELADFLQSGKDAEFLKKIQNTIALGN